MVTERRFPDHHPFSKHELETLSTEAERYSLTLVTTEKDLARIGAARHLSGKEILPFAVTLTFEAHSKVSQFLIERLSHAREQRKVFSG